ncbi:hypothetical protein BY996DRAFT_8395861 [Phakopsora pachyrhizi]|nr:hypothetical protein BY996DRAFT_8395861 [Phakopsora pachyrhizi]
MISIGVGIYFLSFHYLGQVSVMDYLRHRPDQELKSVGFLMPCHSIPWQSHLHKPRLDPIVKRKIDGNVEVEEVEERMWMLSCEPRIKGLLSNNDEKNLLKEDLEDESDRFYKDINGFIKLNFPSSVDPKFPPNLKTKIRHLSKPFKKTSSKDDKINHGSIGNSSSKLIRVEEKQNYQWPSHLVIFESLLYPIEKDKRPDIQKIEKNDDDRDFNSNGISSSKDLRLINHLGKDYLNRLGYKLDFNCFNGFFHYDQSRRGGRVLVFKWNVR